MTEDVRPRLRGYPGTPLGNLPGATHVPWNTDARREWKRAQDEMTSAPLPEPRHSSRDAWPTGLAVPKGPADLAAWAEANGWTVALTYSCGPWPNTRGHSLKRSIGVRCHLGQRYALVFYLSPLARTEWSMGSSLVAGGLVGVFSGCNVTEVREYLERHGEVPPEWFSAVRQRISDAAGRTRQAAKARPRRAKEVHS